MCCDELERGCVSSIFMENNKTAYLYLSLLLNNLFAINDYYHAAKLSVEFSVDVFVLDRLG